MSVSIRVIPTCQVYSFQTLDGILAERYFEILAQDRGMQVSKSTSYQNRSEKWDFEIKDTTGIYKVDVKCMKKINRTDHNPQDEMFWIELDRRRTNSPPIGWLFSGKADIIAFECAEDFVLVKKHELKELVNRTIADKIVTQPEHALNSIYRRKRPGKLFDTISLISSKDVRKIAHDVWEKTNLMKPSAQNKCKHIISSETVYHKETIEMSKFRSNRLKRKRESEVMDNITFFKYCPCCGAKFC